MWGLIVPAAVAGVLVRPTAAAAHAPATQGPAGDTSAEQLLVALRAARGAQRRKKKERRRLSKAAASPPLVAEGCVPGPGRGDALGPAVPSAVAAPPAVDVDSVIAETQKQRIVGVMSVVDDPELVDAMDVDRTAHVDDIVDRVSLANGTWKYTCLKLSKRGEAPFLAVRSARGDSHDDVAEPAMNAYMAMGYRVKLLGGGRVKRDDAKKTIHIYGYSVEDGGAEGGPPGRGMRDHAVVAALVQRALPEYTVTHDCGGY